VQFDRPFHLQSRAPRDAYAIYALEQPLAPGEVMTLTFSVSHATHGFRDGNELAQFAYNGTFFDAEFFPGVGYDQNFELDDPAAAAKSIWVRSRKWPPRRSGGVPRQLFTPNSDWITYHTVVSTSDDQIAIAPGYLQRDWHQDGRHFFEYSMGSLLTCSISTPISPAAMRSARRLHRPGPVNLEVYYDPRITAMTSMTCWRVARRARLLPGALQSLPVPAVPHHGVPALSFLRAVLLQHGAVLGSYRLHHAVAKPTMSI
jgi:ABC-2 type transport system permease protein